jgi:hypothetical protein
MDNQNLYITHYCRIRGGRIVSETGVVFEREHVPLDDFLQQAYDSLQINYPKFFKMDRLSKLGLLAAEVLLKNRLVKGTFQPESVAVVMANANASLDTDLRFQASLKTMPSPSLFVYTLPNIVVGEICIRHGIKGEGAFFVTERFDAAFMANYVSTVFAQPAMQICIAGWIDVLEEHHDVFLYLTQKSGEGASLAHTQEQLKTIYTQELWSS